MFKFQKIKDTKLSFLVPIICLCVIGGITVFSTTYTSTGISNMFYNQIIFYFLGFIIFFGITAFNINRLKNNLVNLVLIVFTLTSLVAVIFLGTEIYGAQRWIDIGIFSFQPSEFTKITIIIVTAFCLVVRRKKLTEEIFDIYANKLSNKELLQKFLLSEGFIKVVTGFLFFLICIVLILKQKSLGNSILISLIFLSVVFFNITLSYKTVMLTVPVAIGILISSDILNTSNLNHLIGINSDFNFFGALISLVFLWFLSKKLKLKFIIVSFLFTIGLLVIPILGFAYNNVLEPYQKQRVESFLGNHNSDSKNLFQDEDYNRQISMIAVGSGRFWGKGLLNGNIVNTRLLPFAYTDFAFAGFAEQFGLIGTVIILFLYIFLIFRIFTVYSKTQDQFFRLVCIGVISLIFFNTLQHIAMNMGLTPITGVPLPLVSYGGSSLIAVFLGLGIVNSIDLQDEQEVEVQSLKSDFGF